ncbi:hypothetical protein V2I21_03320 [Campylobacter sp. CLAX-22107-21]|nr:hypothetical protein [Campylobacter sp. CLAX-22107-21]
MSSIKKYIDDMFTQNNQHINAIQRVQNHLSYKLGRLMIKNSKSIFGWIKMPFSIIATIREYKILTKLTNRITKLPKIETLPDYNEALKYKNLMGYKLGEALLKGLETWYK